MELPVIRREQMDALEEAQTMDFRGRLLQHLNTNYPDYISINDEEYLNRIIDNGMQISRQYGFQKESEVARIVELTLVLGLDFHSNPDYPWAMELLERKDISKQRKLRMLNENGLDHMITNS